ncbi:MULTISPECIES: peptidylprolyl isomerase [unclassified Nostoc]|uniref:peptidylprolyl isomerase n=1 Tax=unclassified Nostoc TaxID=2593658 RepID=UPI002AD35F03|nr:MULTISPECIES: peptidylprolyl isomerase [unclassified Nostoc]MDZ8126262.1 peptidylprolyl isomerase [Nostoc sp. CmiVER01]MDZ8227300.1 peptidylprolyl isomerase [Nostoc sp. ChiVER01]
MSQTITITNEDILSQVKLSCKIPEFVEGILTRKIIANAAAEAGIKVETEELQTVADQIRLMNKLISADDTWAWLQKHSLSIDDYEEIVYSTVISGKLATHLFADKVEPYFFENQLDYVGVVMYEVILDDEDLAIELFYAIKEGEMSFYDIAHKYIQDIELRRKGGYLGIVRRKDLKPEISAAVFTAKPPQLLKPIVTSKGVHLILVEELIQPDLNEKLRTNIISNLFFQWLNQQIEQSETSKST